MLRQHGDEPEAFCEHKRGQRDDARSPDGERQSQHTARLEVDLWIPDRFAQPPHNIELNQIVDVADVQMSAQILWRTGSVPGKIVRAHVETERKRLLDNPERQCGLA